ncbi:peptidylprolyl isomerase [Croceicoccus estronivorus]|uniref:peptidylprolyl isomerase n=1 Tax=Croceicoccus estronivorus TaxID=1172626 RepID=UPI00082AC676|nr:peptidylprolyl isomerase [Croceicoccus estronivorus]OCC23208.1 peptidylprolyl isomerase [Croceicoccus estronivorus]
MIQLIRKLLDSKIGVAAALVFLGLIALAFAGIDVSNSGMFGGVAGGDRAATVGKVKITTSELSRAASRSVEQVRQNQPTMTMQIFLEQNGLDQVLDDLIDRYAIAEYGKQLGLRAGDRLIDSEIANVPAFRGADGNFDNDLYRQVLAQQGLNDKLVRSDIGQGLLAQQVLTPVAFGAVMPGDLVERYTALLKETRKGTIAVIPSETYAPSANPTDAQLKTYYDAHKSDYIRPERRVIRYAVFGADALGDLRAPTEAEIAARFKRDAAQYAASEKRSLTQLIVPTEATAKAILAETAKGTSLAAAAKGKGLATTSVGPIARQALSTQFSKDVADAAFGGAKGAISGPVRSSLGWHLIRVDAVDGTPAKTLDQVRGQIASDLAAEQRRTAVMDLASRLQDEFDGGSSLADAATEVKAKVNETRPLTADGAIYGTRGEKAPEVLTKAISTAFAMEEAEPQLAEIDPGKTFIIFDVKDITPSAAAPLDEIKDTLNAAWKRDQGLAKAKEAADRVLAAMRKGTSAAKAMAAEKKSFPTPDRISLNREQLTQMGERVPAPLALLFSMAEGTVKRLEAPRQMGWFIVQLDNIEPGKVTKDDPMLANVSRELGSVTEREYEQQFRSAARAEIGVTRNDAAIRAVRTQLGGGN